VAESQVSNDVLTE